MQVHHGGHQVAMAEQVLYAVDIDAIFE
jgi:hypothetical protein